MVDCSSDGYVLFLLGPFTTKHIDATILKECLETNQHVMNTISEGDIILVDRGFRVMEFLRKEKKLNVYCPGLGQLDTLKANSWFVTKIRWIIEQVFGRLKKKFKIFALPTHNATLEHNYEALLIAFALLNLFHESIFCDKVHADIANVIKSRLNVPNRLKEVA